MYDDAPVRASHDTSIDLVVSDVAVAVTDSGESIVTAEARTDTALFELVVVAFPNSPEVPRPQHLIVVSANTEHAW